MSAMEQDDLIKLFLKRSLQRCYRESQVSPEEQFGEDSLKAKRILKKGLGGEAHASVQPDSGS